MSKVAWSLFAVLLITLSVNLYAEDEAVEEFLPIGLTEEELLRLDEIGINHVRTAPPTGKIRNVAEWEPSQGVIIRWPLGISYALVAEMSENLMVTTIVGSASQQSSAMSAYASNAVNMENVDFIIAPTNSIWTRDYGPWFIFEDDERMGIVDHIYNRPRPQDDLIPGVIGSEWGLNVYGMDLSHTGGNHMSEGLGMSMSTRLVYSENTDLSHGEVDSIMLAYLGNDYTVLEYIESGGIHHIDCWAKFLSPATILVKDVPSGSSSYSPLNARAETLSQQMSAWGRPYTVVRVYCPYGTAYTNSLILNNKVLVPIFGSEYDDDALQAYSDAMPGYEVIGFTGSWYDDDAIHCRTMGVPDSNMLFIDHIPLSTQSDTLNDYLIGARIVAHSGAGIISDSLKIYYSINDGPYDYTSLYQSAQPDSFYGYIPAQSAATEVAYYLKSADSSGRVETHPYIGEQWAHRFSVELPPELGIVETELVDSLLEGDLGLHYVRVKNTGGGTLRITFSSTDDWLEFSGEEQIIYPADSIDFEVTINAVGLSCGDHTGSLGFISNDSNYPEGNIPVQVHIYIPDIYIAETSIDKNLSGGDTSTYILAIANDGPGRLDFQIGYQMYLATTIGNSMHDVAVPLGYHYADADKPDVPQPYFAPMTTGFGGPDVYGHSWVDSDEEAGPVFDWVDISIVGTEVTLDDDDYAGPFALGFGFQFYDSVYSEVYLGSNGFLTFDEGSGNRANSALPNMEHSSLIAGWWDDLDPRKGGHIYYYYDDTNDRFIASFNEVMFYLGTTGTGSMSFQILLYPDGAIVLQYGTMDSGELTLESATIGIQNSEANDGLLVVYNAPYIHDNLAIVITAEHWLSVVPADGSIDPFGNTMVDIKFDATGLETGEYTGQLVVSSNDPDTPSWNIPVTLTVSSWMCGDIDGSGDGPDIADLVYLVNYMFNGGPPPPVIEAVNVDGIAEIDIADLVYLVNFMFNGGPDLNCQ